MWLLATGIKKKECNIRKDLNCRIHGRIWLLAFHPTSRQPILLRSGQATFFVVSELFRPEERRLSKLLRSADRYRFPFRFLLRLRSSGAEPGCSCYWLSLSTKACDRVRAGTNVDGFHISYFVFRISHFTFHISHFVFHISHFTFHISYFVFRISVLSCSLFGVPYSMFLIPGF